MGENAESPPVTYILPTYDDSLAIDTPYACDGPLEEFSVSEVSALNTYQNATSGMVGFV